MMCHQCGRRRIKTRGLCAACYWHRRVRNELDGLPRIRKPAKPHTGADCEVCTTAQDAVLHGIPAEQVCAVLDMRIDALDRHLRRYAPDLKHLTTKAASKARQARHRQQRSHTT